MSEDDHLRPTEQIVLLTNQIQWLTTRLDKINADLRASIAAGGVDDEHLDLEELHDQSRDKLQEIANQLRSAYEDLAVYMNRRDATLKVDAEITSGTLDHLPE